MSKGNENQKFSETLLSNNIEKTQGKKMSKGNENQKFSETVQHLKP